MVLTHMLQVSGSGELKPALALSHRLHIAFPTVVQGRRSRAVTSEIDTAPVRPPANASPRHHWSSTHSSGPKWVANPSSQRTHTSYPMPILTGAFPTSRMMLWPTYFLPIIVLTQPPLFMCFNDFFKKDFSRLDFLHLIRKFPSIFDCLE
jgi:hypothetical protein